jgi:hypothetical protein
VGTSRRRPAASQINEVFAGTIGTGGNESDAKGKPTQQIKDKRAGPVENKSLEGTRTIYI